MPDPSNAELNFFCPKEVESGNPDLNLPVTSTAFKKILIHLFWMGLLSSWQVADAQDNKTLNLSEAVTSGLQNYQSIKAKRNYYNASSAVLQNTKNEYLPNLVVSAQQNYGTVNGQFGPLGAVGIPGAGGGLAAASGGPSHSEQSWNSAFGALYLTTINWEFFTFGRVRSKIKMSGSQALRDSADLAQEQ